MIKWTNFNDSSYTFWIKTKILLYLKKKVFYKTTSKTYYWFKARNSTTFIKTQRKNILNKTYICPVYIIYNDYRLHSFMHRLSSTLLSKISTDSSKKCAKNHLMRPLVYMISVLRNTLKDKCDEISSRSH